MQIKLFFVVRRSRSRVSPLYAGLCFSRSFCLSFETNELRCSNLIVVIDTE